MISHIKLIPPMITKYWPYSQTILKCISIALLLSAPIIFFSWPILASGSAFIVGDFDMQVQMTEAARISIEHYHQFPLWNPWTSGGAPLFADPQFGLFTITTLLALVTNAVMAWKITFVIYLCIGFFSMSLLLKWLGLNYWLPRMLLSYIYIFNSFFILRFGGGHFTFLLLLFLPLALYLLLSFKSSRHRLVQLALLVAYLLYAAVHYSSIFLVLFLCVFTFSLAAIKIILIVYKREPLREFLKSSEFEQIVFLIKALSLALVIALPRLWLSLHYLHHNGPNRSHSFENYIGVSGGLKALFLPYGEYSTPQAAYGIFEAANYTGMITGILLGSLLILFGAQSLKEKRWKKIPGLLSSPIMILAFLGICAFTIGLGGVLFYAIQHLPVFSSMRVSTRYFTITVFCLLLVLGVLVAQYKSQKVQIALSIVLLVAAWQVMTVGSHQLTTTWGNVSQLKTLDKLQPEVDLSTPPKPVRLWGADVDSHYYNLTNATASHYSQFITDNALVETRAIGSTICKSEMSCTFIATNNAEVLYWSPNYMKIQRSGPGDIILNGNAGSGWLVNGRRLFRDQVVVTSHHRLTIPASEQGVITLSYQPYHIPRKLAL